MAMAKHPFVNSIGAFVVLCRETWPLYDKVVGMRDPGCGGQVLPRATERIEHVVCHEGAKCPHALSISTAIGRAGPL